MHHVSPDPPVGWKGSHWGRGNWIPSRRAGATGRGGGGNATGKVDGEDGELASGIRVQGRRRLCPWLCEASGEAREEELVSDAKASVVRT